MIGVSDIIIYSDFRLIDVIRLPIEIEIDIDINRAFQGANND